MTRTALSRGKDISQDERKRNAQKAHSTQTTVTGLGAMTASIHNNQEFQHMLKSKGVHAQLKLGTPGDRYEREADRTADMIMDKEAIDTNERQPISIIGSKLLQRDIIPVPDTDPISSGPAPRIRDVREPTESEGLISIFIVQPYYSVSELESALGHIAVAVHVGRMNICLSGFGSFASTRSYTEGALPGHYTSHGREVWEYRYILNAEEATTIASRIDEIMDQEDDHAILWIFANCIGMARDVLTRAPTFDALDDVLNRPFTLGPTGMGRLLESLDEQNDLPYNERRIWEPSELFREEEE